MLDHGPFLSLVVLDMAISGDDQPALLGRGGNPDRVERVRGGDRASWADPAALDRATRVARIRDIDPDLAEDLGKAEDIGIDVEADGE